MMDMETIYAARPAAASPAGHRACRHEPRCPSAGAPDRLAARIIADHPEQGWALLCNGIITFDDAGVLLSAA
jgi:hypothetical protein